MRERQLSVSPPEEDEAMRSKATPFVTGFQVWNDSPRSGSYYSMGMTLNAAGSSITLSVVKQAICLLYADHIRADIARMSGEQKMAILNLALSCTSVIDTKILSEQPPTILPDTFCGMEVIVDENIRKDEIRFESKDGELLGKITNVAIREEV